MLQKEIYNNLFNKKSNVVNEENFQTRQVFRALSSLNKEMAKYIQSILSAKGEMPDDEIEDLVYGLNEDLTKSLDLLKQVKF